MVVAVNRLHRACSLGHREIVEALLDAGADVNATDRENWTPMHRAVVLGDVDIVSSIMAFRPRDTNTLGGRNTVRALAQRCGFKDMVRLLDGDLSVLGM